MLLITLTNPIVNEDPRSYINSDEIGSLQTCTFDGSTHLHLSNGASVQIVETIDTILTRMWHAKRARNAYNVADAEASWNIALGREPKE
jgi:hypothetical protein